MKTLAIDTRTDGVPVPVQADQLEGELPSVQDLAMREGRLMFLET